MTAAPGRKQPGRKPLPEGAGKTARVELRVLPATKAAWQAKADSAGMTLQAWIERALSRAK
jgi:predicted HicB family RNase H-like nuclease